MGHNDMVLQALRQALDEEYAMLQEHNNENRRIKCQGRIEGLERAIRIYQAYSGNRSHFRPRWMA